MSRGPPNPSDPPRVAPTTATTGSFVGTPAEPDIENPRVPGQEQEAEGDEEALWNYIQPYLTKHNGTILPTKGWVRQLIGLPQVREPDWNIEWLTEHPFLDSQPRDISALLMQLTGEPAPHPCNKCRIGRGPFNSCIMISSKAESGPIGSIFSCANCFYHYGQIYCTHKEWGAERAAKILGARTGNAGIQFQGGDDLSEDELPQLIPIEDKKTEDASTPSPATPYNPELATAVLEKTESGRHYNVWQGEDGFPALSNQH